MARVSGSGNRRGTDWHSRYVAADIVAPQQNPLSGDRATRPVNAAGHSAVDRPDHFPKSDTRSGTEAPDRAVPH
jgi:hypothetical protein